MRRFAVGMQAALQAIACMTVLLVAQNTWAQDQSPPAPEQQPAQEGKPAPADQPTNPDAPPLQGIPEPGQKSPAASHVGDSGAPEEPVRSQVKPMSDDADAQTVTRDHAWLDRSQQGLHDLVAGTARRVDGWFGPNDDESAYAGASGSLTPAVLWDEFDGIQPKLRFRVDLPLPQLNQRVNAFVGRVDRDEYVSEQNQQSGAFQRQYGPTTQDQTLAGVVYRTPSKQGSRFDAGTGVRLRFPLDPYLKGSYIYERGKSETGLISVRETVFWQNSEHAGFTTRLDLERIVRQRWLLRWTTSGTISERSEGTFGYSEAMALRGLGDRRAIAFAAGFDGSTDAIVPMHEYGFKAAYRQSIARDWLIMEWRTSLTWPKELPEQHRKPSWGAGIGFEMFFGTDEFLARPVTF